MTNKKLHDFFIYIDVICERIDEALNYFRDDPRLRGGGHAGI
jgi:hypothetical protein